MIAVKLGMLLSLNFFETCPRSLLRLIDFEGSFASWSWMSVRAISVQACMWRSRSGARTALAFLPWWKAGAGEEVAGAIMRFLRFVEVR